MKINLKQELILGAFVILPFIYLAIIWGQLPQQVPLHWNLQGDTNRLGNKSELIMIPLLLPLLTYLIFLIVPKIDPKKKIASMGNKFNQLKFILVIFMSVLSLWMLITVNNNAIFGPKPLFILIGTLFIILGNFFKTIKANYFIGIRTPWTLENEVVWKETHKLGGKLWFTGGSAVVLSSLFLTPEINIIIFLVITGIITLVPIVFSYIKFKQL